MGGVELKKKSRKYKIILIALPQNKGNHMANEVHHSRLRRNDIVQAETILPLSFLSTYFQVAMACSLLREGLFEGFKRRRAKAGEHGSAGKMSPRLILPKHKVRAASRLVNNLKNCSGKKAAAATFSAKVKTGDWQK